MFISFFNFSYQRQFEVTTWVIGEHSSYIRFQFSSPVAKGTKNILKIRNSKKNCSIAECAIFSAKVFILICRLILAVRKFTRYHIKTLDRTIWDMEEIEGLEPFMEILQFSKFCLLADEKRPTAQARLETKFDRK